MAEVNFVIKKGLTVPKGIASAPAVIFDASDPNTGIYSPGADQVAISTGGTGRLFVDATGNVGVGTSDPTTYTNGFTTGGGGIAISDAQGAVLALVDDTDTTNYLTWLAQYQADLYQYVKGAGSLIFGTSNTERLRITSDGKLGLGTSTPMNILHVTAANAAGASANDGARVSAGTSLVGINFGADSTATFGWIQSSEAGVAFAPTVINPQGGNVGIGVTSPGDKLEIGGSGSGIILASPDGTRYKLTVANGGTLSIAAA